MRVQCAWCGKDMGEKPPYDDPSTTHSICESCLAEAFKSAFPLISPPPGVKEQSLNLLLTELSEK